jgi:hypothetical protein
MEKRRALGPKQGWYGRGCTAALVVKVTALTLVREEVPLPVSWSHILGHRPR